jgi:hypothetical protein
VGDAIGRAAANRNLRQQGRRGWRPHYPHYHHPYKKISKVKVIEGTDETVKAAKPETIQSLKKNCEEANYNAIIYRLHSKLSFNELLLYVNQFNKRFSYMFYLFSTIFHLFTYLESCVVVARSAIFVVLFVCNIDIRRISRLTIWALYI